MTPPLTPSFLVAAAAGLLGVRDEGADSRGHMIERFLRGVNQPPGQPWCAAFVHHVGYWSHFDFTSRRSSWPLPATASCPTLGAYAEEQQIVHRDPQPGDVFLIWHAPTACYAHTGIVTRVRFAGVSAGGTPWVDCDTIEGNSDAGDYRGGDDGAASGVVSRVRRFYPIEPKGDRFIRWVDLDERWKAGDPHQQIERAA